MKKKQPLFLDVPFRGYSKRKPEFWSDVWRGFRFCYNIVAKLIAWSTAKGKKLVSRLAFFFKWTAQALKNDWTDTRKSLKKRRKAAKKIRKDGLKLDWKWVVIVLLLAWMFSPSIKAIVPSEPPLYKPKPSVVPSLSDTQLVSEPPADPIVVEAAPVESAPASAPEGSDCVTGVTSGDYALNQLIQHESGGRSCAENAGACFGLLQACPGYPLKEACGGNVDCQLNWFTIYKLPTYGTWDVAWSMWQSRCPSPQGCWW